MEFEEIAGGFTFLEAPRVDDLGNLYFSEVMEGGIRRLSPDGRIDAFLADRTHIGGLALTEDGGFVCSGGVGLEYFNPESGVRRSLGLSFGGEVLTGINDIQPDDDGGLYFGGSDFQAIEAGQDPKPGRLYRLDPSGRVDALADGILVSNGIGQSPGRDRLYHVDTFVGLCAYDRAADGTLTGKRVLAAERGLDGIAVDGAGCIWAASYATGAVIRFRPDGAVDRRIDFSSRFAGCRVTSLAFGGEDLRDLYVVTAGDYRKPAAKDGRVYHARSDVAGQPTPKVRF
jgi:sugar lactone lactonase YvrE